MFLGIGDWGFGVGGFGGGGQPPPPQPPKPPPHTPHTRIYKNNYILKK